MLTRLLNSLTPRGRLIVGLLPTLALLAACSDIPLRQREEAQRNRYLDYAGQPVPQFTWLGHYDSWTPISRNELVIWTNINDAYLITVQEPCQDLQFSNRIGLTSTAHTVYQRFDSVKVRGFNCMIKEIRPVNYLKMKQDMRAKAAEAKAAEKTQKE